MIVAKSEKTSLGNTVVLYWDNNSKKYQLNVFDSSNNYSDDVPTSISGSLDKTNAFDVFDRIVWTS